MRTYDLSPLYRSTVGFDRLFGLLDSATNGEAQPYPPYNIERTGENAYRVTMAVAGFGEGDLDIQAKENVLTVKGEKKEEKGGERPRGALSRYRLARFRAPLPARRPRRSDRREPRQRPAPHRPRARDSGGDEAPQDRDRRRPRRSRSTPRPPDPQALSGPSFHAPRLVRGAFVFSRASSRKGSTSSARRRERGDEADQRLALAEVYAGAARPFVEVGALGGEPFRVRAAKRRRRSRCRRSARPRAHAATRAIPARSRSAIALAWPREPQPEPVAGDRRRTAPRRSATWRRAARRACAGTRMSRGKRRIEEHDRLRREAAVLGARRRRGCRRPPSRSSPPAWRSSARARWRSARRPCGAAGRCALRDRADLADRHRANRACPPRSAA